MHPFLEKEQVSKLSDDEIFQKISEIQKRMGIAHQTGRTDSLYQLQLLLEHYQSILNERLMEEQQKIIDSDPKLSRTVIDIDWPDPHEEKQE